ncbi:MAG: NfeD family protein [Bacteroidota bacterium]
MEWLTILGLMLFGSVLIVAEIIFVPGTTIVGILGFLFSAYCIYLGYEYYGAGTGTLILLGGMVFNVAALVIAFKSKSWERFSLKNQLMGSHDDETRLSLSIGERGITLSSLKPVGKAIFQDKEIEVRSNGGFVNENEQIEIIKLEGSKIFVQPINK